MDRKPSAVRFPLHSDVSLLAQRRRELLGETHQKAPEARRLPLPPATQRCHPPLPRRHQCKPKALYLDQGPQQNHRRRQARAPIVRFDPLGYPDAALADMNRAISDARGTGQAATLMFALGHAPLTLLLSGNYVSAATVIEEV